MFLVKRGNRNISPLRSWQDELERFYGDFFSDFPKVLGESSGSRFPKLDLKRTDESISLSMDLPGMEEKDIDVSIDNNQLTVSGEYKREDGEENLYSERFYGSFARSVSLPDWVKSDEATAEYKNGVLTITIPRAEEVKPKRIEVKAAS